MRSSRCRSAKTHSNLRGLNLDAAIVLGNVANTDDVEMLATALDDPELLVRASAARVRRRLGFPDTKSSD